MEPGGTQRDVINGYAAALLEVASAEGDAARITDELSQIARVFDSSEELRETLGDPKVPIERKQGVVADVLGGRASSISIALINLLVSAGRSGELAVVADRMMTLSAERQELTRAEVRSAIPLDEATVARLEARLAEMTGKNIRADVVVDPSVIGGVVTKIGDTVLDGSVKNRIQELREVWG